MRKAPRPVPHRQIVIQIRKRQRKTYESSYHFHEYQGYGDEVDDEYEGADYDDYDTNWYDDYDNDEDEHWAY